MGLLLGVFLFGSFLLLLNTKWIESPIFLREVDASYEKRACKLNTDLQNGYILR